MDQIRPVRSEVTARAITFRAGLFAAVVLGLGLRLMRLDHGLPDLLEEAAPLRSALAMWGWPGGPPLTNLPVPGPDRVSS